MTTETIGAMRYQGRVFIEGCGRADWFSQATGDEYIAELEKLDPRYTSLTNGAVFEVEERAAQEFIARVMAPRLAKGVVPMRNDYRKYPHASELD